MPLSYKFSLKQAAEAKVPEQTLFRMVDMEGLRAVAHKNQELRVQGGSEVGVLM